MTRRALVFGASGFLGRWLIVELAAQGVPVVAAVRSEESGRTLAGWLGEHDVAAGVEYVRADFEAGDLGLGEFRDVSEIHNLAGAFRFGMSAEEAYQGNVVSARRIVELAARLDPPPRVVHVSGYRVGSHGRRFDEQVAEARAAYDRLGAYEASKIEADAVLQQTAIELGVPYTVVNPSTVSGVAATGESDQYVGLAKTLADLWRGALPAVPGNRDTFVPVVSVDHLARFMALVPTVDEAAGHPYWVLDDHTPGLPDLLRLVGDHYRVPVPRMRIPVGLIRRLPSSITKADPETLSFLDTARYPTGPADELAAAHDLRQPETVPALLRWADHLAAYRFGVIAPGGPARGFASYDGVRTFSVGDADATTLVLPPLPMNAETWAEVAGSMPEPARVLDLPGLGMSAGGERDWETWLASVASGRTGLHLVGHSVGAGLAVRFAAAHPDQVDRLTLVAPAFLQPAAGRAQRVRALTAAYLRFAKPGALARTLLGDQERAGQLATVVADLRRPGVARRAARLISHGARRDVRDELRRLLAGYAGEVHVIVGEHDPLEEVSGLKVTTIAGAGHYPQLTHPAQLLAAVTSARTPMTSVGEVAGAYSGE